MSKRLLTMLCVGEGTSWSGRWSSDWSGGHPAGDVPPAAAAGHAGGALWASGPRWRAPGAPCVSWENYKQHRHHGWAEVTRAREGSRQGAWSRQRAWSWRWGLAWLWGHPLRTPSHLSVAYTPDTTQRHEPRRFPRIYQLSVAFSHTFQHRLTHFHLSFTNYSVFFIVPRVLQLILLLVIVLTSKSAQ